MLNNPWGSTQQTMIVCVDSYDKGVLTGKLYLSPQSFTTPRIFAMPKPLEDAPAEVGELTRGALATFEMRILFRQHASWQGELQWLERNAQQSFRSVLELITLMDSALREESF